MPEAIQKPAVVKDMIVDEIDGVRLYSRRNTDDKCTLNASSPQRTLIERLAEKLHRKGYGVKRETFVLDAKTHYDLEATWLGDGDAPYGVPD